MNIIHLENSKEDAAQVAQILKKAIPGVVVESVDDWEGFVAAEDGASWDIVLCGYSFPNLKMEDVLLASKKKDPFRPFLLVTGVFGEEGAARVIHLGVDDIVVKNNLQLLGRTVLRTIQESAMRREFHQNQKLLEESRLLYRDLWDLASTGFLLLKDNVILDCNKAILNTFGCNKEAIIGKSPEEFPVSVATSEKAGYVHAQEILKGGKVDSFHFRWIHRHFSGRPVHCEVTLKTISIEEKAYFVADIRDVTRRDADTAELLLKDRALQGTTNGIVISRYGGEDNPIIWVNDAFLKISGYSLEEVLNRDCRFLNAGDRDQAGIAEIRRALKAKVGTRTIIMNARKDGTKFWNELRIDPVFNAQGVVTHYIGVLQDITEKVEFESKLKRSESHLREIGRLSRVGIWEVNLNSGEAFWSEVARQIYEVPDDYIPSLEHSFSFFGQSDQARIRYAIRRAEVHGEAFDFEAEIMTSKGKNRWVRFLGLPVTADGGLLIRGAIQDISAQKDNEAKRLQLRDEVLQLQRIDTIGTLAGGIAHDFNNLLGVIQGWSELTLRHSSGNEKASFDLQHVFKAVDRSRGLIEQILTFSRKSVSQRKPMDLGAVVEQAVDMLQSTIPKTVLIHLSIEDSLPAVLGDVNQLNQVLMNLCTNAYQAIAGGHGNIWVSLKSSILENATNLTRSPFESFPCVRLEVRDDGPGIPKENLARIFDPFFTTKGKAKGTGLGLSVVHGIVQSHQGTINVVSSGEGTRFTVDIPVFEKREIAQVELEDNISLHGSERILLIEDEVEIGKAVSELLIHLGYSVESFESSISALECFREDPDRFDLILTDHVMPRMTGLELIDEMRKIRPELPVLVSTGSIDSLDSDLLQLVENSLVLFKPHTGVDLSKALRKLLD